VITWSPKEALASVAGELTQHCVCHLWKHEISHAVFKLLPINCVQEKKLRTIYSNAKKSKMLEFTFFWPSAKSYQACKGTRKYTPSGREK
jgi:hypothetical protein